MTQNICCHEPSAQAGGVPGEMRARHAKCGTVLVAA